MQRLKPSTHVIHRNALTGINDWKYRRGLPLLTAEDVVLAAYADMHTYSRSKAEFLVCALLRVCPALRPDLIRGPEVEAPVATVLEDHRLICVCDADPHPSRVFRQVGASHIVPGPICAFCRREITQAQGIEECPRCYAGPFHLACHRYHVCGPLQPSTCLGPGTKAGRPQIARAHDHDWQAFYLSEFFADTPSEASLADMMTYRALRTVVRQALIATSHGAAFAPHSVRTGWASVHYAAGQPFAELQEDGRWCSPASLRIHLDAVATADYLNEPHMTTRLPRLRLLVASMHVWLR